MTNLIEKVSELRELEGRRQAIVDRQQETGRPNHALLERLEIERDMLNAIPAMLDALSKIQAGDAEDIDWIIKNYGFTLRDHIGMLRRLRDLACQMEMHEEGDT